MKWYTTSSCTIYNDLVYVVLRTAPTDGEYGTEKIATTWIHHIRLVTSEKWLLISDSTPKMRWFSVFLLPLLLFYLSHNPTPTLAINLWGKKTLHFWPIVCLENLYLIRLSYRSLVSEYLSCLRCPTFFCKKTRSETIQFLRSNSLKGGRGCCIFFFCALLTDITSWVQSLLTSFRKYSTP